MIHALFLWLFGTTEYRVKNAGAHLVNYIFTLKLPVGGFRAEDGDLLFYSLTFSRRRVLKALSGQSTEYRGRGLPAWLWKYRKRFGIEAGVIAFVLIIWLSSRFVWQINVVGNETVDDETVINNLSQIGFEVGSYIPSVNVRLLCNQYLLKYDGVSWMSVNIVGNCAEVRIRESSYPDNTNNSRNTPGDIIASRDGFIERIELRNGQIIIGAGHSVRQGEVIVSGAVEQKTGQQRLLKADADVFALTERDFRIEIPFCSSVTETEPVGQKDYSLVFFSETLPFFSKTDEYRDFMSYSDTRYITLPGGISLPFGIRITTFYTENNKTELLDLRQASERANAELADRIKEDLSDADIISVRKLYIETNETLILEATVRSIENIAREQSLIAP